MSEPVNDPRSVRAATSATTTVAVVVAVVAVLLGFLILRDISNDTASAPVTTEAPADTTLVMTTTTAVPEPSTTLLTEGFEVLVANASGIGGSAGKLTDQLKSKGFVMLEATNAAAGTPTQASTVVYYLSGYGAGAASVATVLGGVSVLPMPTPVPVADGSLGSASVLVMLGTDQAGKKLPKRVAVENPEVAGGTADTVVADTVAPETADTTVSG